MEVGSGRGWRWFSSGIEAFCEDWAAQESMGEEFAGSSVRARTGRDNPETNNLKTKALRCARAPGATAGIRAGMFWQGQVRAGAEMLAVRWPPNGIRISGKGSWSLRMSCNRLIYGKIFGSFGVLQKNTYVSA